MPQKKQAKKIAKSISHKKVIHKRVTKPRVKPHAKRVNLTKKRASYKRGSPNQLLSIRYNGVGNEFVFTLENNQGRIGSKFIVNGQTLMGAVGMPLMVTSI